MPHNRLVEMVHKAHKLKDSVQKLPRYFSIILVVCRMFVPKQCVECMSIFFPQLSYIFVQKILDFSLSLLFYIVFCATCSIFFLICGSIDPCIPLYLTLSLCLASSITS